MKDMKAILNTTVKITRSFFALVFVSGILLMLNASTVSALDPNSIPDNAPPYDGWRQAIEDYNNTCASNPNKYAIVPWVSPRNNPGSPGQVVSVPLNETVVQLQFNTGVFLCQQLVNGDSRSYDGLPNDGTPNGSVSLLQNFTYIDGSSVSPDGSLEPGGAPSGGR